MIFILVSVCLSALPYFRFQAVTWVSINAFPPNCVCALILRSGSGIANGQILFIFDRVICPRHDNGGVLSFHVFILPNFTLVRPCPSVRPNEAFINKSTLNLNIAVNDSLAWLWCRKNVKLRNGIYAIETSSLRLVWAKYESYILHAESLRLVWTKYESYILHTSAVMYTFQNLNTAVIDKV